MNASGIRVPQPRRPETTLLDPPERRDRIVVGVDGSPASIHALVWAMRHALAQNFEVDVVTAWPIGAAVFVHEVPGHFAEARWNAVQAQAQALARALSLLGSPPRYSRRLENADPQDALVRAAITGDLLVLGSDRALDSTVEADEDGGAVPLSVRVQRQAVCPVVLIPYRAAIDVFPGRTGAPLVATDASGTD